MELQFLGGASEVGRSSFLLKGSKRILLDHGIKLNEKTEYPGEAKDVDACILSHAHIDHSGFVPYLYKEVFPTTYGTAPTKELSQLLINDSMKIAMKRHTAQKFSKRQLKMFTERFAAYEFGEEIAFGEYSIKLHDAAHISGSAITSIEHKNRTLVYTGDFKLDEQGLQGSAEIVKSNILITESTYADREHPDRKELIRKFIDEIKGVIDDGGTALIPVFAVGRAQEIVKVLYDHNLADISYLDGMAKKATEIVLRYPGFCANIGALQAAMKKITRLGEEVSRSHIGAGQEVIVTTAGMLNGGPVLEYITRLNQRSRIFLTGYQVEGTNGRKVLDGRPITIRGKKQLIKTPVSYYDFSAHAGKSDLYEYARKSSPETVICVHGERASAEQLAEGLKLEGFDAKVPSRGETIKLDF